MGSRETTEKSSFSENEPELPLEYFRYNSLDTSKMNAV
jgi:hypothetical protein